MKEFNLDDYASLFVDAIRSKEDSAKSKIKIAELELELVENDKNKLMAYIISSLGIDMKEQIFSIDFKNKKVIVKDRPKTEPAVVK